MNSILKYFFVVLLLCTTGNCFSQTKKETFYAFDAGWNPTKSMDSCTYFMHEIKKNDTEFICRYYNKFGPMIKQESYKDAALSTPNGFFCWYNEKGKIDSSGWVQNFKKDGRWNYFLGDSVNTTYYDDYENGKFIKRGAYNNSDTLKEEKDSTEKAALFRKGVESWTKYVYANMKPPDRFVNNTKAGDYIVSVMFTIGKTGKVETVYLLKSVEWSADAEVIQTIEASPQWQPAIQHGKPVLYRERQNIHFHVDK